MQWRMKLKAPFRSTSRTRSKLSSFIMASRPSWVMPALLTRMSTVPKSFFTWATTALAAAKSATSHW